MREAAAWGLLDGVTTNPTLVAKEGRGFQDILEEIVTIVNGPISAEVISTDTEGMLREGRNLAKIHKNIVIKLPMIHEGLRACRQLIQESHRVNMTLVFSPAQALLAAKAGATFVSPFIGRMDDVSQSGMELVRQILTIYQNYQYSTELLVASIRHPIHVVEAALAGADIGTMPFSVMQQLVKHPLTDSGLKKFLADWERVPSR